MDGELTLATAEHVGDVADLLCRSHTEYPGFRELFPDAGQRMKVLRPFLRATARDAIRHGRCYLALDPSRRVAGVAVWLEPGSWPISARRKARMTPELLRCMVHAGRRFPGFARAGAVLEGEAPDEPCWYLQAMGVAPEAQRQGIGGRLLAPVLAEADTTGTPCLLHTSDDANIAYYTRFGFAAVRPYRPAYPGGPSYILMRRPPT